MFYNTFIDGCSTIDIYMILFTPVYDIHCQCFNCDHKYYHVVIDLFSHVFCSFKNTHSKPDTKWLARF